MNVLAISCHPDDMEIFCGGTLLRCKKRGDNVTVCHVANGNRGHVVIGPEELRKIRLAEAQKAGEIGGFKVVTCDVGDLCVDSANRETHDKLVEIIREAKPDFIITHAPNDYMSDHNETSKLAFDASFAASCPQYRPDLGDAVNACPIFYMDNEGFFDFEPTEFVDITEEIDTKIEMLACHESQVVWLRDHDGDDILERTRKTSGARGTQCGVEYAEAFRQCMRGLRVVPRRLLP